MTDAIVTAAPRRRASVSELNILLVLVAICAVFEILGWRLAFDLQRRFARIAEQGRCRSDAGRLNTGQRLYTRESPLVKIEFGVA